MEIQEKRLVKNTIIYAIGNLGSKVLVYVMVLVYSYYIHAEELGYYDLILTSVGLVLPVVVLGINEAIYRFMVDKDNSKQGMVLGTAYRFILAITVALSIIFATIGMLFRIRYWALILAYSISTLFFSSIQESLRGLSLTKFYAGIGLFNSLITLLLEFFFLIILKMGIDALLISKIIANTICIVYGAVKSPILNGVVNSRFDKPLFRELLLYSLPLVPNIICWWVMNTSDRYIVRYYLGASYNGIYAIANKFPTILTSITSVFYLAWQESAIKAYGQKNKNEFFSNIFNQYFRVLFSLCLVLVPATKIVSLYFVSAEYSSSWQFSTVLFYASAFSALCSFLGIGYQVSKETIRSLYTTIIAALINFAFNMIFINIIGLHAASISTLVAYAVLFVIRIAHTKRYYLVRYNKIEEIILLMLNLIMCIITFSFNNFYCLMVIVMISLGVFIRFNYSIIKPIIRRFIKHG